MFSNYVKTAFRSIGKDKQHFFLNLIGFSIGLAAAILMALFAVHELSYDKHQPDSERVYIAHTDYTPVGLQTIASSNYRNVEQILNHSQVEDVFRLTKAAQLFESANDLVQLNGTHFRLKNFYAATNNILNFMQLEAVSGDVIQALSHPNQLALSEAEAIRLFGDTQVVGQTLYTEQGQYRVSAVFKNLPENTHVKFDSLIQMPATFVKEGFGFSYFKFLPNTDIASLEQALTTILHESWQGTGNPEITMMLINMQDMHLEGKGPYFMKKAGSASLLQICIGLSLILIVVASINFINLNIAQSAKRAKEVGVRKALGATKGHIVAQFLTESLLVVAFSSLLAFTFVELSLPHFNQMMDRQLSLEYTSNFMFMTVGIILFVGLLSGLYPALFIASFSAKRVLSGDLVRGGTAIFVRKLTLCLQSALSVGLIIATVSLYQQISLINALEVGYAKSERLVVKGLPNEALYQQNNNQFFTAIRNLPGVEQVTASNTDLTHDMQYDFRFTWPNGERVDGFQPTVGTGYYAVETLGLTLIAGRDFSPQFSGDWHVQNEDESRAAGILVSRRMLEIAGYDSPESVIGMTVTEPRYQLTATIVGVVEDVKIGSARQQALPVSFNLGFNHSPTANLVIKTNTANTAQLRRDIQRVVHEELHLSDVNISLVEEDFENAHQNENRALDMVSIFSLFAIFLTCLGTFGLASFATIRRQKEVAVRKVLGASRVSIVNLLAKEFLLLVAVSIAIAFPISYLLVADWLANFNERIEQVFWVYLLAAGTIALITWVTVATLGFKSASARPSLILRYE